MTDRPMQPSDDDHGTDRGETLLQEFLTHHPQARLGAVTADAAVRVVPLPPGVPVPAGQPRLEAERLTSMVVATDQAVLSRTWWQARRAGAAGAPLRLEDGGGSTVSLFFFDLSRRHGVLAVAAVDGAVAGPLGEGPDPGAGRHSRIRKDGSAMILAVDAAFERLLGWPPEDAVGHRSLEFVHPDDQDTAIDHWVRMCEESGPSRPVRLRHRHSDGRWVWLEVTNHNRLADPAYSCVVADMVDVTEEVTAGEALRARQQLLEQITSALPIGLLHADRAGRLLYVNDRLAAMTGLFPGAELSSWPGLAGERDRRALTDALATSLAGSPSRVTVGGLDPEGRLRQWSLALMPLQDGGGPVSGVTGSFEDVTSTVAERRELEARAATDSLTGCLNRAATLTVLQDALDRLPGGDSAGVAVAFVDVDGLKAVNDRLGHLAGDALLVEVARRLRGAVRLHDAVGRVGGDEFLVVAEHVDSPEHALNLGRWIAARIAGPLEIDDQPVPVRASLGVAWTGEAGLDAAALVGRADGAMYHSKREGRCEAAMAATL